MAKSDSVRAYLELIKKRLPGLDMSTRVRQKMKTHLDKEEPKEQEVQLSFIWEGLAEDSRDRVVR